jgi:hypothetical protein
VRPSACHDEIVVYRITPTKTSDSLALDARKIVRGEEQEMGVLGCRLAQASGQLTCIIPRGVWRCNESQNRTRFPILPKPWLGALIRFSHY